MAYGESRIHHLLVKGDWNGVLDGLRTDPSMRDETRQPGSQDGSGDLPLYTACDFRAPDEVVLEILRHNESAARIRGRGGNLPLHCAVRRGLGADTVEGLIRSHPVALGAPNATGHRPSDYGHQDQYARQCLERPAACWCKLMEDEAKEEEQDSRLAELHGLVGSSLVRIRKSNEAYDGILARLEGVESRLCELDSKVDPTNHEGHANALEERLDTETESLERTLIAAEAGAKSSAAREFMARAAGWARQSDVSRKVKKATEEAEALEREIESIGAEVESRRRTAQRCR